MKVASHSVHLRRLGVACGRAQAQGQREFSHRARESCAPRTCAVGERGPPDGPAGDAGYEGEVKADKIDSVSRSGDVPHLLPKAKLEKKTFFMSPVGFVHRGRKRQPDR